MSFAYIVLGAGRQGTAAAYDLARFGDAERVTLADISIDQAQASAERVRALVGSESRAVIEAMALDVRNLDAVRRVLKGYTVALSAVPYYYNLDLTRAAIEARVSFCDLGGHTDIVRQQHALDGEARQAGVRVVPDCGMGPGMGNTLAVYAMGLLDQAEHVFLYDGGLPQNPQPPWNYLATFSIEGLANEYYGGMTVLREGKLVYLPCFSELEIVEFPDLGPLEAFVAAGGVSTAPWTFRGKLQTYQLKILRYPGTYAQLKAFSDLGLFSPEPITVGDVQVSPREVFKALYEPQVRADVMRDICLIRARVLGIKDGRPAEVLVDLVDRYDEATGFTAMERTTGWHASIVAIMLARGETPVGAMPLEIAVPGAAFVREARRRGFAITEQVTVKEEAAQPEQPLPTGKEPFREPLPHTVPGGGNRPEACTERSRSDGPQSRFLDRSKAIQDYYPDQLAYCYGCGRLNKHGLQIKSYWQGDEAVATYTPRAYHIALPGYVYGGLIASLIDCHGTGTAAAAAYRAAGRSMDTEPPLRFVTAALHVDYLKPTPLGVPLQLRGRVKEMQGRKVVVAITLSAKGQVCARGEVVAVQMPEHFLPSAASNAA